MAIPKYDDITLPLLRLLADGHEHHQRELAPRIADEFNLTQEEREAKLPSHQSTYLRNRTGWAGFHLRKAGLAELPRVATLRITDEGKRFLRSNPPQITRTVLMQFEPFRAYMQQFKEQIKHGVDSGASLSTAKGEEEDARTPEELIANSYALLRAQLASDLLLRVKAGTPTFFEQLVVDLLIKMGYGGSREDAGRATKPTGDNGIDGVIDEDRLGLDAIYVQAKKWENTVGEPELRDFVGALHAHQARKGVFMTTSDFSEPARRYVEKVTFKISLVNGQKLAELMIDFGVGVSLAHNYEIKKMDHDYFADE